MALRSSAQHPAFILAALGAMSGTLGTTALGVGIGAAPHLGLYMVLTGLWFGAVVAFGVWRWGNPSSAAAVTALIATWIGWELAVNLAMQLSENWLKATALSPTMRTFVGGFTAGAVGASMTWAGAAASASALRQISVLARFVTMGALFGLLLQLTNQFDSPAILLVPWQVAVATLLGICLAPRHVADPSSGTLSPRGG